MMQFSETGVGPLVGKGKLKRTRNLAECTWHTTQTLLKPMAKCLLTLIRSEYYPTLVLVCPPIFIVKGQDYQGNFEFTSSTDPGFMIGARILELQR